MKQLPLLTAFMAVATFATAVNAHAETWQVLLPGPVPDYSPSGTGQDLLINPFNSSPAPGVFLAIGSVSAEGPSIFRLTPTDAASSSFTMEPVDAGLPGVGRLAYNPGDGLYAVGYSMTTTGTKGRTQSTMSWKVRRSSAADQGNKNTWQDTDSFQFSGISKGKTTTYNSRAHGITTDASGNVYVCGWANDGRVNHWIVRKKSATGWARDPVLNIMAADAYSLPYNICFVPAGGNNPADAIFVVGLLNDRWTVYRSTNQGATWQALEPWPADGSLASAYDVGSDSTGNVYVVGVRGRDGQNRGWVLRKSSDGGDNWGDPPLLDQPSTTDSWAVRLSIDASDIITLAGAIDGANGSPRWAVVRNTPGQDWTGATTASWETRLFPFGENTSPLSKGRGIVTDASGNMFFTGDVVDWTDLDGTYYSSTRVGLLRMVP